MKNDFIQYGIICVSSSSVFIIWENALISFCLFIIFQNKPNFETETDSENVFYTLKKLRDIECVKLNQSSNVLKAIIEKPECDWREKLLAETILLENGKFSTYFQVYSIYYGKWYFSELRYQLIADKIRELNNTEEAKSTKGHTADIVLTNFQFEMQEVTLGKSGTVQFFVLVVSYDTQLLMSKAVTPVDGKLVFTEKFCLRNVDERLCAKVEVYSMKMKTERSFVDSLLRKVSNLMICN